jgi:hypothetical protein
LREPEKWVHYILCPPELDLLLRGGHPTHLLPITGVAGTIGRFISGHALTISRRKKVVWSRQNVDLEQLEGFDEVWLLCYRKPRPGWRLAGRFLERGVLILFEAHDKLLIGNDYSGVAAQIDQMWRQRFGSRAPHSGSSIADYLNGNHHDVDQKKDP